jgi:hypothetical protein
MDWIARYEYLDIYNFWLPGLQAAAPAAATSPLTWFTQDKYLLSEMKQGYATRAGLICTAASGGAVKA